MRLTTENRLTVPAVVETPVADVETAPSRWWPSGGTLVAICLLIGFAFRVGVYVRDSSLWIDEAMLALNVVNRSPAELMKPLDWNQGAPLGFLMASKAAIALLGDNERAMRTIPFLASLVGLLIFPAFAYRAMPIPIARLATILFALSPNLIGYAAEFKQYELDATIAIGLLALGLPMANESRAAWRSIALAFVGALAVWCSHPSVFVLGGVGLAILADGIARRDWRATFIRLIVVSGWLVSFAACYLVFLRHLGLNAYLLDYWAGTFLPLPPTRPGDLAWIVHHYFVFFDNPCGMNGDFNLAGFAGIGFLVGCLSLAKTNWRLLIALLAPLLLALLASGLKKYPFAGRLMLFAVPLAIVGMAYGLNLISEQIGKAVAGGRWLILAIAFIGPISECNQLAKRPIHAENTREAIAAVYAAWQPGDRVYVFYGAVPAFEYYRSRYPIPVDDAVIGVENRGKDPRHFREEMSVLRGQKRVWILMAHRQTHEEATIRAYLDGFGKGEIIMRGTDAVVVLYDLS